MASAYKVLLLILCLSFSLTISAQEVMSDYNSLLEHGASLVKQGMYDDAEKVYKRAIRLNTARKEAYLELARFKMKQKDWGAAKSSLKKLLKMYPEHIDGHYLMGTCDRNDAIGKDIVRRRLLWHWSKKHFLKVIEKDSAYKEVFREYARLKRDQSDYYQAIELSHTQLRLHPQSPGASYDIFSYYDLFLYQGGANAFNPFSDNTEYQLDWLKKRNTDYDHYFIGEKYRRLGKYTQADSIFARLLKKNLEFSKIPVLLSLTRLNYQMDKPEAAEEKYWQAVNDIQLPYEVHFLFDDVFYIMADKDINVRFKDLNDIKRYYQRFWNRKNPLPGMEYNARLEEHYRRLIKSEKDFIYHGQRLAINNPERLEYIKLPQLLKRNKKLNDKGLVYIRYGEPNEKAVYGGADVQLNESWLYYQSNTQPRLIFHFEIAGHASPGDWRLVSVPTDQSMLETRLGWDKNLDKLYMARDAHEYTIFYNEAQSIAGEEIGEAMSHDKHTWSEKISSIPLTLSTAQFRDAGNKNRFEVYLGLPQEGLGKKDDSLSIGWTLFNKEWDKIGGASFIEKISLSETDKFRYGQLILPFHYETDLDKIYVSVFVKDLDSTRLGGYKFALQRTSFLQNELAMSDLVTAFMVQPLASKNDRFYKHGLSVIPNPEQIFSKDNPVYLYYEIYNLTVKDGQSRYKIKQTIENVSSAGNIFSKIAGFFTGKSGDKISITKDHQGASAVSYEYSAFDFSAFTGGKYRIKITIKDFNSGQETSAAAEIELK